MTDFDIPDDMKKTYLERRKKDLEDCTQAAAENNFAVLTRISHQIKGNASSFGFKDLSQIAIALEKATIEKDLVRIKSALKQFEAFLTQY